MRIWKQKKVVPSYDTLGMKISFGNWDTFLMHRYILYPPKPHNNEKFTLKGQVTFLKRRLLVVCLALTIPRFTLF